MNDWFCVVGVRHRRQLGGSGMADRKRRTAIVGAIVSIFALSAGAVASAEAADLTASPPVGPASEASESFPRWFVRIGALGVLNQSWSKLYAQPVIEAFAPGIGFVPIGAGPQESLVGRGAVYSNLATANLQAGYFLTRNWSVEISGGIPVWETVRITGFSAAGPAAGTVLSTVLPAAPPLTVVYHFSGFGALQPYLGVGTTVSFAFQVRDGFNTQGSISPSLGVVLQGGFDYMLDRHWGVFVDVKKIFVQSTGRAVGVNLGPPVGVIPDAASIRTTSQPWLLATGFVYRF
jgi:outer membrane protein